MTLSRYSPGGLGSPVEAGSGVPSISASGPTWGQSAAPSSIGRASGPFQGALRGRGSFALVAGAIGPQPARSIAPRRSHLRVVAATAAARLGAVSAPRSCCARGRTTWMGTAMGRNARACGVEGNSASSAAPTRSQNSHGCSLREPLRAPGQVTSASRSSPALGNLSTSQWSAWDPLRLLSGHPQVGPSCLTGGVN